MAGKVWGIRAARGGTTILPLQGAVHSPTSPHSPPQMQPAHCPLCRPVGCPPSLLPCTLTHRALAQRRSPPEPHPDQASASAFHPTPSPLLTPPPALTTPALLTHHASAVNPQPQPPLLTPRACRPPSQRPPSPPPWSRGAAPPGPGTSLRRGRPGRRAAAAGQPAPAAAWPQPARAGRAGVGGGGREQVGGGGGEKGPGYPAVWVSCAAPGWRNSGCDACELAGRAAPAAGAAAQKQSGIMVPLPTGQRTLRAERWLQGGRLALAQAAARAVCSGPATSATIRPPPPPALPPPLMVPALALGREPPCKAAAAGGEAGGGSRRRCCCCCSCCCGGGGSSSCCG